MGGIKQLTVLDSFMQGDRLEWKHTYRRGAVLSLVRDDATPAQDKPIRRKGVNFSFVTTDDFFSKEVS